MQDTYKRRIMARFMTREELDNFDSKYAMFKSPTLSGYVEGGVIVEEKISKFKF